jgi:hypothetical protein
MAVNPKTLDFSPLSEFLVATARKVRDAARPASSEVRGDKAVRLTHSAPDSRDSSPGFGSASDGIFRRDNLQFQSQLRAFRIAKVRTDKLGTQ